MDWVASILATALALIHRNYQQVVERINDAMIDPVTGRHNQRFVTGHAERELARARRVEKARRGVAAAGLECTSAVMPLRISAGVAVFPDDGDRFDTLFSAADARMYVCTRADRSAWRCSA